MSTSIPQAIETISTLPSVTHIALARDEIGYPFLIGFGSDFSPAAHEQAGDGNLLLDCSVWEDRSLYQHIIREMVKTGNGGPVTIWTRQQAA